MNVLEKMRQPFQQQPEAAPSPLEAANDDPGAKGRRQRLLVISIIVVLATAVGIYVMSHTLGGEDALPRERR